MSASDSRAAAIGMALGCMLVGCGDDEGESSAIDTISVQVTGALPGPVTFSWDGAVTTLDVVSCSGMCVELTCENDVPFAGNSSTIWSRGDSLDFDTTITGPVVYGMIGPAPDPSAFPLTAGSVHAVGIVRNAACDPPEPDCAQAVARGCALFTL